MQKGLGFFVVVDTTEYLTLTHHEKSNLCITEKQKHKKKNKSPDMQYIKTLEWCLEKTAVI